MKRYLVISVIAMTTAGIGGGNAEAQGRDPLVIPAYEPQRAGAPVPQRQQHHAQRAPVHAAPAYAPQRATRAQRGQYGGGFIEMLMTGRDPTPSQGTVTYHQPRPAPQARYRSQPAPQVYAPDPFNTPRTRQMQASLAVPDMRPGRMVDPRFNRQEVAYDGGHSAGTIVVDTPNRFLYLVTGNGRALRYGIGVGRPGFEWAGTKSVTRKAEWPDWRPPPEMLKRRPDLPKFMAGGPENPMGARALYLGSSLYRIHGTNEPETIGTNVSSGCIRMMNDDVVDL